jgi:uncharacterized membrane protein YkgB
MKKLIKKYSKWFSELSPLQKWVVSYMLNWFFWLFAWLIAEKFVFEETRSWKYLIFHATWMAFIFTFSLLWEVIKQFFKPQNSKNQQQQNPETDI